MTGHWRNGARLLVLATMLVAAVPAVGQAQYFGQNKVRYGNIEFQVLSTEHFDIYFYEAESKAIPIAARLAERWYARLSAQLGHELSRRQPVIFYASHADFQATTVIEGFIGEGTGGVTEGARNRVVLPFTASLADTSHVLGHELVHAFQFDMSRGRAQVLPLWFVEGMAEYLSLGPIHRQSAMWLRDAAQRDELPGFDDLDHPRYFPYRFGHAAWAYLAGVWGDDVVGDIFREASAVGDPLRVIAGRAGGSIDEVSRRWHDLIRDTYGPALSRQPSGAGRTLIAEDNGGGRVNIGPALSPDGTRLVFLSERDQFSIEMYLADAQSGRVLRTLTELATDAHLDSIQFIASSGAWDRDGRRFAYTAVSGPAARLIVIDGASGDTLNEVDLSPLSEALNPTWSPSGRSIAFTAMVDGASDLYMYDLQTLRLERLTNDLYAQLQPAWSPDGRGIAFVTDQFTSDLDTLEFGAYRIGLFDVVSGMSRMMPGFDSVAHANPRWAPDGSLLFIADPGGIPNVYRVAAAGGSPEAVTDVTTGVTGITEVSPALDVALQSGRLAFSVFTDGGYEIHVLDQGEGAATAARPEVNAALLPPARRGGERIAGLRPLARAGAAATQGEVRPYTPALGLDYVGAAAGSTLGADAFGTYIGGGVTLSFSDMLNYHRVSATAAVAGRPRDAALQVSYLNQASRWNWGGVVQHIPLVAGTFAQGFTQINGQTVFVEEENLVRQIDRELLGLLQYPFSRTTRVEFAGGLRSIGFDREVTTRIFSAQTGGQLAEDTEDLDAPATINLTQTMAAFVRDTSVFGVASPVAGMRTRLELAPTFGSLSFVEATADVRRYFVPARPLTLAGRALFVGRYGQDGEDPRLTPLFVGYPHLVRGYDFDSFSADECIPIAGVECPAFDRLIGSRLFVANAELRFPLVGVFQGRFNYGPLPIEGLLFADTGVAWTESEGPSLSDGTRQFVSSVGAGLRVNTFGYLVLEFDAVRPLDRPDAGWRFVFNALPGF